MADFDPRQLDQLEDALENLEDIDDLASLELSPALTGRLAEYQDVLALCREAFPIEEPSDALLVDVLAEARAVSRRPKLREADGDGRRRFWDRWRGTLIPGLALAGTAVAVLWVLEPGSGRLSGDQLADRDDQQSAQQSEDKPDPTPSEPASEPAVDPDNDNDNDDSDPDDDDRQDDAEPQRAPEALGATDPVEDPPSETAGLKKSKPRARKHAEPAVEPAPPAPEPMSKDETWTSLDRANADRRKGDCDRARSRYEEVIAASADSLAVARAKAGIGLCLEQDRRASEAASWFDDARSAHAGIDAWINNQRDEQPLPGETKKRRSKKSAAKTDSL